ncbi:4'-phosphopantetheinyl transferase superfamily protein, partial [Pseudomonas aeruginosa]|uniref:4'-phosphopantetheinyl transferase superfamily protein n=1 Tax=Pseudomonas aeruginosa TaxID=287 RepID=UPI0031B6D9FA
MDAVHPDQQLEMFWRIWTRKEAIVKQRGGSAWQIVSVDSTYNSSLSVSHCQLENLSLAICTPTPFTLTADRLGGPCPDPRSMLKKSFNSLLTT